MENTEIKKSSNKKYIIIVCILYLIIFIFIFLLIISIKNEKNKVVESENKIETKLTEDEVKDSTIDEYNSEKSDNLFEDLSDLNE